MLLVTLNWYRWLIKSDCVLVGGGLFVNFDWCFFRLFCLKRIFFGSSFEANELVGVSNYFGSIIDRFIDF